MNHLLAFLSRKFRVFSDVLYAETEQTPSLKRISLRGLTGDNLCHQGVSARIDYEHIHCVVSFRKDRVYSDTDAKEMWNRCQQQ